MNEEADENYYPEPESEDDMNRKADYNQRYQDWKSEQRSAY